jgi:hypothetical protein
MERVPVLDAGGKPTGQYEHRWGKGGELGYFEWLARNHPGYFAALYGKLIPLDVNAKVEEKAVVRYETVEERRQAMIDKGWSPTVLAALEEAMEPKFLRDMREENEREESVREENEGQGEAVEPAPRYAAPPDATALAEAHQRFSLAEQRLLSHLKVMFAEMRLSGDVL